MSIEDSRKADDGGLPPESTGDEHATRTHWIEDALDRLGIGAIEVDNSTGTIARATPALARMFGVPSAEMLIGVKTSVSFTDPKEREESLARFAKGSTTEERGWVRLEGQRKRLDNGETIDVLMSLALDYGDDGKVAWIRGLFEDIGERKHKEMAFRTGAERFRVLFDTSPVGMALTSLDGRIARVNGAFCRFMERDETALLGTMFHDLVDEADRASADHLVHDSSALANGELADLGGIEWRFTRPGHKIAWGSVNASLLTEEGKPHSRVILVQDATARKKMEAAMMRQEKLEAVGRLAGGIAHDFNNALTTILGNVSLAGDGGGVDDNARERLAVAERAIGRAQHLTRQLITFARGGRPVTEVACLKAIAQDTAELCLSGGTTRTELEAEPDLWPARVDPGQIGQVFQNLLLNAAEASSAAATIKLRLGNHRIEARGRKGHPVLPEGRYVKASVIDSGEGIPAVRIGRIFDPYFSTRERGSGMGLAVVQSVVRQHGGAVEVESNPGHGSAFHFWLPACDEAVRCPDRATPPPARPFTLSPTNQVRILAMDDDPDLLDLERRVAERAGYRVDVSLCGEDAVALFKAARAEDRPFDLVVLDLTVVGGMGGVETLEHLRAIDPELRAIVSSGYSEDPVMSDFTKYGFVACLPKPFSTQQLTEVLGRVLD